MANEPFRNNRGVRAGSMGKTLPDVTPNGEVSGLASKLGSALGYKKGGHKMGPAGGLPMPSPGLHSMAGHNPGVTDGMATLRGIGRVSTQGMGAASGPKGPSLPRAGLSGREGAMVPDHTGITGGDDDVRRARTRPVSPKAGFRSSRPK